jgi:phosphoglycerol transferase MdoB-like AlkP superfamily enzyme
MRIYFSLLKQYLFWLTVFALQRIIFFVYYNQLISADDIPLTEVLYSFVAAFKLDTSTAVYILIFPFLLLVFSQFRGSRVLDVLNKVYTAIVLLVYLMISAGETGLYGEWKTKLSFKALIYFKHPGEVFRSATITETVLFFAMVTVQFFVFYFLYKKFVFVSLREKQGGRGFWKTVNGFVLAAIMFIGIRGGLEAIPISLSESYFSKHRILNMGAVNPAYNLVYNTIDYFTMFKHNVFKTLDDREAERVVKRLHYVPKDTTVNILNIKKPNIVVIFLESFSGDLIESLGGDPRIAPNFHQMEKDGLLFTNFYASGNRSQQALGSLYAGLPSIPITTLTAHPEKYKSVPSLVKILNGEGYFSSFYFGGQLIYGNIRSFIISNGFDRVVEGKDFDKSIPRQRLGVPDEYMLERFLNDMGKMKRPFFANAFTLSSHSPYDVPGGWPMKWVKLENKFVNSAHYTDKCLGDFFRKAKQQSWWDSTLFIVMADHSHASYHNYHLGSFEYHKIPLLITGGALKKEYRGKQNNTLMGNVDVTATLLHQLGLPSGEFFWSKNIFNPYVQHFAYFDLYNGFGWKRPYGELIVSMKPYRIWKFTAPKDKIDSMKKEGFSYVQYLFENFIKM